MKRLLYTFCLLLIFGSEHIYSQENYDYNGRFCSGNGELASLRLIDESFAFFHPNPVVPNLSMVYQPEWNTLEEGAGWGAWWIQNSYGFSYAAVPFLQEPWFSLLQRSWDLHWKHQGDGKRKGLHSDESSYTYNLVAPDGSLGDAASPHFIVYKQGDGNVKIHDWYYEGAAAAVIMQAEILLASRDTAKIKHYLPKMKRACDFIERTRDPENNLFRVGPASNLLAPSFGGVQLSDGTFGKSYLAGLSISCLAALDRMAELYKITGNELQLREIEKRRKMTRESLSLLKAADGYFVKSVEPGGLKHGVLGQEKYGYLEGVANADAVALRVADELTAEKIYEQIAAYPDIRPFDFLLTNAPGLDDTYWSWGNTSGPGMGGFHKFGEWVNGGVWGTVEGRAILMYARLGKFEDIHRSASRAMKWAKDFRMDAPWSQFGENTSNPWSDTGKFQTEGVAVMIDNFAIPAATIRGLFDYDYRSDRLILRPSIPPSISLYTQKEPVRFGEKKLFLSVQNEGPVIAKAEINEEVIKNNSSGEMVLLYDELPMEAHVRITMTGGWSEKLPGADYPVLPSLTAPVSSPQSEIPAMPESLKKPFEHLSAMKEVLAKEPKMNFEKAFVGEALEAIEACRLRSSVETGEGYFRALTPERIQAINRFYEQAALAMYGGFVNQMERYRIEGNADQKALGELFEAITPVNH